jgi:quercetin dioxygenase-like cupin family protein
MAVSGAQTGGAFEVIEFRGNAACPPPHIHREREECIQVLEGRFTFTLAASPAEAYGEPRAVLRPDRRPQG